VRYLIKLHCRQGAKSAESNKRKRNKPTPAWEVHYIHYYLSLPEETRAQLVGIPEAGVHELIRLYTEYLSKQRCYKPSTRSPFACILFILLFLRHYPTLLFIATIFELHTSTAQRLAHKMLGFLYDLLSPRLTFQSHDFRCHHARYILGGLVTYALDGAEQPVHGSRHVLVDCVFYSAKKEQHSINVLVLVALNGTILWLSSSNGGGTNDLDLARRELAKWAIHFDADEHGVADAGFNGLDVDGVNLFDSTNLQCRVTSGQSKVFLSAYHC